MVMKKKKSDLHILLMQIRDEPRVREEEYESFVLYSGLSKSQIDILNVFDTPTFSPNVIKGYDALMVGGASEASVSEKDKYPFVDYGEKLLLHCLDKNIPVFASCFGFQLAVIALGGSLTKDEKDFEMGVITIRLTKAAQEDPLFKHLSGSFPAISVHQEKTLQAPKGCIALAYTDVCCHSFRVKDKPFWTFQFHPEVDKKTLIERLTIFKKQYTQDDDHLKSILATAAETPESNGLVQKFVEKILLKS